MVAFAPGVEQTDNSLNVLPDFGKAYSVHHFFADGCSDIGLTKGSLHAAVGAVGLAEAEIQIAGTAAAVG